MQQDLPADNSRGMHSAAEVVARVLSPDQLIQRAWNGGITTEIAIYPAASSYEQRDFDCRISTASVNSNGPFTQFPGYTRILALLSGAGIKLNIDDEEKVLSARFQQIRFNGAAKVQAELLSGEIQDFNLIFKPEVSAQLNVDLISPSLQKYILPKPISENTVETFVRRIDLLYVIDSPIRVHFDAKVFKVDVKGIFESQQSYPAAAEPELGLQACSGDTSVLIASLFLPKKV